MRVFILTSTILTIGIIAAPRAQAQTYPFDRYALRLGGSAAISSVHSRTDGGRDLRGHVEPSISYFFVPNLSVGGSFGFEFQDSSVDIVLGPSVAYYLGREKRRHTPYVSSGFRFVPSDVSGTGLWHVETGMATLIAHNVAMTSALYYRGLASDLTDTDDYGLRMGFSVFLHYRE